MRPYLLLLSFLFLAVIFLPVAQAHPPQDEVVTYDFESQTLKISARHTTHDPREDYVRKLVIFLNGEGVETEYFNIQINTITFEHELELAAEDGDLIEVELFSKEGGRSSGEVTVIEPSVDEDAADQKVSVKKRAGEAKKKMSQEESKGSGGY